MATTFTVRWVGTSGRKQSDSKVGGTAAMLRCRQLEADARPYEVTKSTGEAVRWPKVVDPDIEPAVKEWLATYQPGTNW